MTKRSPKARGTIAPAETRTAEILTVAWMLAVMTTLLCELGSIVGAWFQHVGQAVALLAAYLFFSALVIGTTSLLLGVAVLRLRRVRPPQGVLVFALIVGAAPLVALLVRWLWSAQRGADF